MPYNPNNNPYIPGDPYSYDLKWIVEELKKAINLYTPLNQKFDDLYAYVINYFSNLDIDSAISSKLEEMAADGSLKALLNELLEEFKIEVTEEINRQTGEINTLSARMDTFTHLAEGSTTGDAELMDARTAYNGVTYPNAGDAIRESFKGIVERTDNIAVCDFDTYTQLGVTVKNTNNVLDLSGTSGGVNQRFITPVYELAAGTYCFGFSSPVNNTIAEIQVRQTDAGGTDVGPIKTTSNTDVFTLNANTYARLRLYVKNSAVTNFSRGVFLRPGSTNRSFIKPYLPVNSEYENLINSCYKTLDSATGMDLDTKTDPGFCIIGAGWTILNAPDGPGASGPRALFVYSQFGYIYQEFIKHAENYYIRWQRAYANGAWQPWTIIDTMPDNRNNSYSPVQDTTTAAYIAPLHIKVMSYNVANYDNDSATLIPTEKQYNFKKMLNEIDPDFIGIQEGAEYIDLANTMKEQEYLFNPRYPVFIGSGGCTIKSRVSPSESDILTYTTGRLLRYALYEINSKKILMISTHPVADYNGTGATSAQSIAARASQYEELFKWINGDITLERYGEIVNISVPVHDYAIIAADMNTLTATDKTNLQTLAGTYGFNLANGGYMGWIETAPKYPHDLDNIICSANVKIEKFVSLTSQFAALYSDHVPVYAELALTE